MAIDRANYQTEGALRNFIQVGSPSAALPTNRTLFGGVDGQHSIITDQARARRGSITPARVPHPRFRKQFLTVAESEEPADAPTATVQFVRKHGGIPRTLYDLGYCPVTFYQSAGECKDPGDFNNGWTDFLLIHADGIAGDAPLGGQQGWDSDEIVSDSMDFTFREVYAAGMLTADLDVEVTNRQMLAAAYGTPDSCTTCSLGTETIYVIAISTANQQPYLFWTVDGGGTWSNSTLSPWTDETVNDIAVVNNQLVIPYNGGTYGGDGGYYLVTLDPVTGVPNIGSETQVEAGWGSSRYPTSVYALSPTQVFFTSQTGSIYVSNQLSAGVRVVEAGAVSKDDLLRIHGVGEILVAVGEDNYVLYSVDAGRTWSEPVAAPTIGVLRGVHVLNKFVWWVCGDDESDDPDTAYLTYTVDGGRSWTRLQPAGRGSLTSGFDVRFATPECGYFLAKTDAEAGSIELYTTCDGGFSWVAQGSRFTSNFVTNVGYRIAVPDNTHPEIAANNAVIAGNKTGSPNPGQIWRLAPTVF